MDSVRCSPQQSHPVGKRWAICSRPDELGDGKAMRITEGIPHHWVPLESPRPAMGNRRNRTSVSRYIASPRTCASACRRECGRCHPARAFDGVLGHLGLLETVRRRSPRQDHSDRRTSNANLEPAWTTEEREIGRHLPLRYLTPI